MDSPVLFTDPPNTKAVRTIIYSDTLENRIQSLLWLRTFEELPLAMVSLRESISFGVLLDCGEPYIKSIEKMIAESAKEETMGEED